MTMRSLRPPDWAADGACVGRVSRDTDPWHPAPELPRTTRQVQYAAARRVCAGCPVRHACALEALTDAIADGMWGGLEPDDRRQVAARYGFPRPGLPAHGTRSRYGHRTEPCRCELCREAMRRYVAEVTARKGQEAAHGRSKASRAA